MQKFLMCTVVLLAAVFQLDAKVLARYNFDKKIAPWFTPSYWGGKIAWTAERGGCLHMTPTTRRNNLFCRAYAYLPQVKCLPGTEFKFTVSASGKGELVAAMICYLGNSSPEEMIYLPGKSTMLSDKEQQFTYTVKLPEAYRRVLPILQLCGAGEAFVNDYKLELVSPGAPAAVKPAAGTTSLIVREDRFSDGLNGWQTPKYWAGKVESVSADGFNVLKLTAGKRGNEVFGRAFGRVQRNTEYIPGKKLKVRLIAAGTGEFTAGILAYGPKGTSPQYEYLAPKPMKLGADFGAYEFEIELKRAYRQALPFIQINGNNTIMVRNFSMRVFTDAGVKIDAQNVLQIIKDGATPAPVKFVSSLPEKELFTTLSSNGKQLCSTQKTDARGAITFNVPPCKTGHTILSAAASGACANANVIVEKAADYDASDAIAKKVKISKPLNILFIGDSLSDYWRGYNYIDRLAFWVNKYNPGKFNFRNAGVGGDYIWRVVHRLDGVIRKKNNSYRQEMYDGLFDVKYDMIFVFLGQNDTCSKRTDRFKKPTVTPEKQRDGFERMIAVLKKYEPQAKIVFISPSPSDPDMFYKRDKTFPAGRQIFMFGQPELVNAFDKVNRELCKKYNFDYVDILNPMRADKNRASLYVADGVHLSYKGGRVIADLLLKYFAEKVK